MHFITDKNNANAEQNKIIFETENCKVKSFSFSATEFYKEELVEKKQNFIKYQKFIKKFKIYAKSAPINLNKSYKI